MKHREVNLTLYFLLPPPPPLAVSDLEAEGPHLERSCSLLTFPHVARPTPLAASLCINLPVSACMWLCAGAVISRRRTSP